MADINAGLIPDTEASLNAEYLSKYDNHTQAASSIIGDTLKGGAAAAVDFGATVWNSLPGVEEVQTADLLRKIDPDILRVYEENTDAVELASFVGGLFIPSSLALKGMNLARDGMKGVNWFSKAGREADLASIKESFRKGATAEWRATKNAYYAKGIANQALDAFAMEAAVVGSMNAHTYMEDYMDDPFKNFALSVGFGGAIGGVVGHVANRFEMRSALGDIVETSMGSVLKELRPVEEKAFNVTQMQTRKVNINTLDNILKQENLDELTKQFASTLKKREEAAMVEDFQKLAPSLQKESVEVQAFVRETLLDPRFSAVETVQFLKPAEGIATSFFAKNMNVDTQLSFMRQMQSGTTRVIDRVYFTKFGKFGSAKDADQLATASDLGLKEVDITGASLNKTAHLVPNNAAQEELFSYKSATAHRTYLEALKYVDNLDDKQLVKAAVSPDDLPMLNAFFARASKNPELKVKLTKQEPNYEVLEQAVARVGGVKSTHMSDLRALATRSSQYNLGTAPLSEQASKFLQAGTYGNSYAKSEFRSAFDAFFRKASVSPNAELAREIYQSKEAVSLRKELMRHADTEGNIYLYRGIASGKTVGHAAIESYTPVRATAAKFGKSNLFKVHVEDVVGVVDNGHGEFEYLVGSPARQTMAQLPVGELRQVMAQGGSSVREIGITELSETLMRTKESMLDTMIRMGKSIEEMSIKTDTPVETVKQYLLMGNGASLLDTQSPFIASASVGRIAEYLAPETRSLHLTTSETKAPYAALKANLDIRTASLINREFTMTAMQTSNSMMAKEFYTYWKDKQSLIDILSQEVAKANNFKAGSKFFQSSDFWSRHMGELGKIAPVIGKQLQDRIIRLQEAVLKEISPAFAKVAADPVDVVEFNTALAVHAAIKGRRIYQDRQFFIEVEKIGLDGKKTLDLVPATYQGGEFMVKSDAVDSALKALATQGAELKESINLNNKLLGKPPVHDIGTWFPAFNPKGKYITYVYDSADGTTKLLWGRTALELDSAEKAFTTANLAKIESGNIQLISKSQQRDWSILNNRLDPVHMAIANVEKFHAGSSAPAIVSATTDSFNEIVGAFEHYIQANAMKLNDMILHEITDNLERMSLFNQRFYKDQPLSKIQKAVQQPQDAARTMKNTLLGNSNLHEYTFWRDANDSFETGLTMAMENGRSLFYEMLKPLRGILPKARTDEAAIAKFDYEIYSKEAAKRGMVNPFAAYDEEAAKVFKLANITESKDISRRAVYASNSLAATVALRFGELAQPLVNAMSLPILTMSATTARYPATFMGAKKGTASVGLVQAIYEGARFPATALGKQLDELFTKEGYYAPFVSEATKVLQQARSFDKGITSSLEHALDSNFVKWMSKPSDSMEAITRRQAMMTGAALAKRMYPELDNNGILIFARDFMDRTIGNYHSAQRPVFFQGTMGVALGLFQTYMVTMAQSIYGQLELRNYKALAKTMLTQGTIFGAGSLPGFQQVSEMIGEHFSDNHVDLTTGVMRGTGDTMADLVLYGLPSNFGPAFYSRGELAPRVPNVFGGVNNIAAINMIQQSMGFAGDVVNSVAQTDPDAARSLGQAFALQSLSRPLARTAELFTGYSTTRQGNTVAVPEEVWTFTSIASRLLATRPLEEAKLREAIHAHTFYGSLERERRQDVIKELKIAIRSDSLTGDKVSALAEEYLRTGTPSGWQGAINNALAETNVSGKYALIKKLDPEDPLNYMIDTLD